MKIEELKSKDLKKHLLKKQETLLIEVEDRIDELAELPEEELEKRGQSIEKELRELKNRRQELEEKIKEIYEER